MLFSESGLRPRLLKHELGSTWLLSYLLFVGHTAYFRGDRLHVLVAIRHFVYWGLVVCDQVDGLPWYSDWNVHRYEGAGL